VADQDAAVGSGVQACPADFAALAAGERWYVVHALAHGEERAQCRLAAQGFRSFLPRHVKTVRHARKLRSVRAPFFPRYLFVVLDLTRDRLALRQLDRRRGKSGDGRHLSAGPRRPVWSRGWPPPAVPAIWSDPATGSGSGIGRACSAARSPGLSANWCASMAAPGAGAAGSHGRSGAGVDRARRAGAGRLRARPCAAAQRPGSGSPSHPECGSLDFTPSPRTALRAMDEGGIMKSVILAGGFGTRISERNPSQAKPMVEIGGMPILWHIMKLYSAHGVNDFVICCGYKGYVIKEYFANYFLHMSDVTFDMANNQMEVHHPSRRAVEGHARRHGREHPHGGRLKRVSPYLLGEDAFCFTYGTGRRHQRLGRDRISQKARQIGDRHGSEAAGPVRRPERG